MVFCYNNPKTGQDCYNTTEFLTPKKLAQGPALRTKWWFSSVSCCRLSCSCFFALYSFILCSESLDLALSFFDQNFKKPDLLVYIVTSPDTILDIFTSQDFLQFVDLFYTSFGSAQINSTVSELWWTSIGQEENLAQASRKHCNQIVFKCF